MECVVLSGEHSNAVRLTLNILTMTAFTPISLLHAFRVATTRSGLTNKDVAVSLVGRSIGHINDVLKGKRISRPVVRAVLKFISAHDPRLLAEISDPNVQHVYKDWDEMMSDALTQSTATSHRVHS